MTAGRMFTKAEAQKGGWARARAWAEWRRNNPSPAEAATQEFLKNQGVDFFVEFEIVHPNGQPQFFDILVPAWNMAIEVDGSHGWHNYDGKSNNLKMGLLDEIKIKYCEAHGILFVSTKGTPQDIKKIPPK